MLHASCLIQPLTETLGPIVKSILDATLYDTLATIEKAMIERALEMADNVQAHAAAMLGIGKSGLNQKLKKYNLDVGPKR